MPVRKTESRIATNLQTSDLGQAVITGDGHCALVSFITLPLVVNRENVYDLFLTDAALAAAARSSLEDSHERERSIDQSAADIGTKTGWITEA